MGLLLAHSSCGAHLVERAQMDIKSSRGTRGQGWQFAAFWGVCTPSFKEMTYELKKKDTTKISVFWVL